MSSTQDPKEPVLPIFFASFTFFAVPLETFLFIVPVAGAVTKLLYQKRNRERVNVHLDGAYAFALPEVEAAKLKIGQYLSDDDIAGLQQIDSEAKAYDSALRFLGHRPRSQHELETNLKQKGYPPEIIAKIVARLQHQAYIDDAAFVTWWLDNRTRFSPRGRQALRQELRQKGVNEKLVETALIDLDDDELALAAGHARVSRWEHLPQPDFYKKMLGYLQRRGFYYSSARSATDQLWQQIGQDEDD